MVFGSYVNLLSDVGCVELCKLRERGGPGCEGKGGCDGVWSYVNCLCAAGRHEADEGLGKFVIRWG